MQATRRHRRMKKKAKAALGGFTLLELLLVIGILAVLVGVVFANIGGIMKKAYDARARAELAQIANATKQYIIDNGGVWPADADRALPPGIEEYLGPGTWPDAPWPGSVYDYDAITGSDGKPVYQISIRFCPLGEPENCVFPEEEWATDFDYFSSVYFCLEGRCRAHDTKPDDHPGYCINC